MKTISKYDESEKVDQVKAVVYDTTAFGATI